MNQCTSCHVDCEIIACFTHRRAEWAPLSDPGTIELVMPAFVHWTVADSLAAAAAAAAAVGECLEELPAAVAA